MALTGNLNNSLSEMRCLPSFSSKSRNHPSQGRCRNRLTSSGTLMCARKWTQVESKGHLFQRECRISYETNFNSRRHKITPVKVFYDPVKPHKTGTIQVSEKHKLYFEVSGNPKGIPALFLHGGPGAGCYPNHARFFDPDVFRVVLFDQRSCGRSEPQGTLVENTTQDLIEDIEKLRSHLEVEKWLLLGGSWGTTLALLYAQSYPENVSGLILRGLCLLRKSEIDWFYKEGGASTLFPLQWKAFSGAVSLEEQSNLVNSYYQRLTSQDPQIRDSAASAWLKWEMALSNFQEVSPLIHWDGSQFWAGDKSFVLPPIESLPPLNFGGTPTLEASEKLPQRTVQARLECHYFYHNGFIRENQILEEIDKIRHIPCSVVQGRFDFVCPIKNAFDLHKVWPEAFISIVPNSGHSMYEKGIAKELINATKRFGKILKT